MDVMCGMDDGWNEVYEGEGGIGIGRLRQVE